MTTRRKAIQKAVRGLGRHDGRLPLRRTEPRGACAEAGVGAPYFRLLPVSRLAPPNVNFIIRAFGIREGSG